MRFFVCFGPDSPVIAPQGSADLWVWSTLLRASAANLKGHGIYNPGRSSTAKLSPGLKWKISYGDGSGASSCIFAVVFIPS
jgi:Eukaryotic aspartyl protease